MNSGGDAAEQIVRLSLEGFEVAAKLTGSAAKNIAILLASVLKEEHRTKGKARLTNLIKSGKELKVFSIESKDLKMFTQQAKKYGVLYCVLRDKASKNPNAPVDIIARAEDASKIQRIIERFELCSVDKAAIVTEAQRAVEQREELQQDKPTKSQNEIIAQKAVHSSKFNEKAEVPNPDIAKTDKNPPSEQHYNSMDHTDKGKSTQEKPSVREKLNAYKKELDEKNKADRSKDKNKTQKPRENGKTVHKQPKKKSKSKER